MANKTGKGGFTGKDDPRRNNGGVPALTDETKDLKNLTREEHIKLVCQLLRNTPQEIRELLKSPYTNCHTRLIISLIVKAIKKGDAFIYEKLTDRVLGKVTLPIGNDNENPFRIIIEHDKQPKD